MVWISSTTDGRGAGMYVLLALLGSGGSILVLVCVQLLSCLPTVQLASLFQSSGCRSDDCQRVACAVIIAPYCQASMSFGAPQLMDITLSITPLSTGLSL